MINKTNYPLFYIIQEYQNYVESDISKKYIQEIFNILKKKYENDPKNIEISDLDIIIENFEESIYYPNDINSRFFKAKHVYNFRKNMINDFNYYLKKNYI
jgi:hypothetical protein